MSIENLTLAHFRHFSSLFTNLPAYKAADIYVPIRHPSTFVESPLHLSRTLYKSALLCKTNPILSAVGGLQMNLSFYSTRAYENIRNWTLGQNKPNSNPIKPNFKRAKMNVNSFITKDYRKNDALAVQKNKPNSKPISVKPKMNVNSLIKMNYENKSNWTLSENKPKQSQFYLPPKACPELRRRG